jgi:hypothetical protein
MDTRFKLQSYEPNPNPDVWHLPQILKVIYDNPEFKLLIKKLNGRKYQFTKLKDGPGSKIGHYLKNIHESRCMIFS